MLRELWPDGKDRRASSTANCAPAQVNGAAGGDARYDPHTAAKCGRGRPAADLRMSVTSTVSPLASKSASSNSGRGISGLCVRDRRKRTISVRNTTLTGMAYEAMRTGKDGTRSGRRGLVKDASVKSMGRAYGRMKTWMAAGTTQPMRRTDTHSTAGMLRAEMSISAATDDMALH